MKSKMGRTYDAIESSTYTDKRVTFNLANVKGKGGSYSLVAKAIVTSYFFCGIYFYIPPKPQITIPHTFGKKGLKLTT